MIQHKVCCVNFIRNKLKSMKTNRIIPTYLTLMGTVWFHRVHPRELMLFLLKISVTIYIYIYIFGGGKFNKAFYSTLKERKNLSTMWLPIGLEYIFDLWAWKLPSVSALEDLSLITACCEKEARVPWFEGPTNSLQWTTHGAMAYYIISSHFTLGSTWMEDPGSWWNLRATLHTWLKARDHRVLRSLIRQQGQECPSSLHTRRRRWRSKGSKKLS